MPGLPVGRAVPSAGPDRKHAHPDSPVSGAPLSQRDPLVAALGQLHHDLGQAVADLMTMADSAIPAMLANIFGAALQLAPALLTFAPKTIDQLGWAHEHAKAKQLVELREALLHAHRCLYRLLAELGVDPPA
jgi:hypothetical protein